MTLILDPVAIDVMLHSPEGPVVRNLVQKATRFVSGAKRRCPVDTGRLRQSIRYEIHRDHAGVFAHCGTDVEYAAAVELGHGPIVPVNATILHFTVGGQDVFTMQVSATEGVHFLENALDDIRGT